MKGGMDFSKFKAFAAKAKDAAGNMAAKAKVAANAAAEKAKVAAAKAKVAAGEAAAKAKVAANKAAEKAKQVAEEQSVKQCKKLVANYEAKQAALAAAPVEAPAAPAAPVAPAAPAAPAAPVEAPVPPAPVDQTAGGLDMAKGVKTIIDNTKFIFYMTKDAVDATGKKINKYAKNTMKFMRGGQYEKAKKELSKMEKQCGGSQCGGGVVFSGKDNFYKQIGVERSATDEEIKKAYRKQALKLHPDRHYGEEKKYNALFQELNHAYEMLSKYRSYYNQFLDGSLYAEINAKRLEKGFRMNFNNTPKTQKKPSHTKKTQKPKTKKTQKPKTKKTQKSKKPTVAELKKICKKNGIKGYSKLRKAELEKKCLKKEESKKASPSKASPKSNDKCVESKQKKYHKSTRKAPAIPAKNCEVGTIKRGNDGKQYIIITQRRFNGMLFKKWAPYF